MAEIENVHEIDSLSDCVASCVQKLKVSLMAHENRTSHLVKKPGLIDLNVGHRLRRARRNANYSLKELAELASISTQQLQKYESGRNRISASRLFELSKLVRKPVSWFFTELGGKKALPEKSTQSRRFEQSKFGRNSSDSALLQSYFVGLTEKEDQQLLLEFARLLHDRRSTAND